MNFKYRVNSEMSESKEGHGEDGAHSSHQDEGVHETKVSRSSESKVSETRLAIMV